MGKIKNWRKLKEGRWQHTSHPDFVVEWYQDEDNGLYYIDVWKQSWHVNIDVANNKRHANMAAVEWMREVSDIQAFWGED